MGRWRHGRFSTGRRGRKRYIACLRGSSCCNGLGLFSICRLKSRGCPVRTFSKTFSKRGNMAINGIPHTTIVLLCLTSFCAFVSCDGLADSGSMQTESAFAENGGMGLTLSPSKVTTGALFTLTSRCTPRFTGKGRTWIYSSAITQTGVVHVESPVSDTLYQAHGNTPRRAMIETEFTGGRPLVQNWGVRFNESVEYRFATGIMIDSIYLPDSLRMMPADHPAVRLYCGIPKGSGWTTTAMSDLVSFYP